MSKVHDKEEPYKTAVERAREYGIDISLLEMNLKRTPTERIEAMISVLEFVEEARASLLKKQEKHSND